jgi:deazaflavin-dependent oxidoreductase (nitroreductase family)
LVTLEVVGRRTGKPISFPLVLLMLDGRRYLVSMLGEQAGWVHNVRAAGGRAVLRHGRTEHVALHEVPMAQRARILKAYLSVAPGARPHLAVNKDAPLEAFAPVAAEFPVFTVEVDRSQQVGRDDRSTATRK